MKITLVGPVYPYRGGIAHYTAMLYHALKVEGDNINLISFKRQYPDWLFPGKSDREVGGKLTDADKSAEYLLDPMNPLTWRQTAKHIRQWEPDLIILQWWVPFWVPAWWTLTTLLRRWSNARIVFICHNIYSHEPKLWDKYLARMVLRKGHSFVVHAEAERERLRALLPNALVKVNPLPTYDIFQRNELTLSEARSKLGIEPGQKIILFFGLVRPYKGLDILLESLALLKGTLSATLFVVGEFWISEAKVWQQIKALKLTGQVILLNQYVPNDEVELYFASADVVVLPYKEATQSAVIQIAYGFNRPVITTQVGGLGEAVKDGVTGFVVSPDNSRELSIAIERFFAFSPLERENLRNNIRLEADKFSWNRMVTTLKAVY